ncbi:hypothetical protein CCUS01_08135 [Colletotrichum cuscutae]|uniref:Uncharacterized protein n=1 Tax=Colletotrichum cuscutae TaxID=1209917 RepID=A0AAI9UVK0_9PEZI|nr:hypothetical protein CCUS01_08135 [Colletotrichum cuscutae]
MAPTVTFPMSDMSMFPSTPNIHRCACRPDYLHSDCPAFNLLQPKAGRRMFPRFERFPRYPSIPPCNLSHPIHPSIHPSTQLSSTLGTTTKYLDKNGPATPPSLPSTR